MLSLRFLGWIPIVSAVAASVLMSIIGAVKTVNAYRIYFFHASLSEEVPAHLDYADQAMIAVVEGIDAFLIAIAAIVFAAGVHGILIGEIPGAKEKPALEAFQVRSMSQLKQMLMEVLMVVLTVLYLRGLLLYEGLELYWAALVVPISVALIALSLKWVGWRR